jgi:uncharacterized protein YecE (DUF72 family)
LYNIKLNIGTAGWTQRKEHAHLFLTEGSHLEKYADVYNAVEINSSFYKDHLAKSYRRWAESVQDDFRFAVKLSKAYTHEFKLKKTDDHLKKILSDMNELGNNFGVLLVQLPPSLKFDQRTTENFFSKIIPWVSAPIVLEARNQTWADEKALEVLNEMEISLVHADPELFEWPKRLRQKINYFRLHGSPEIYKSSYSPRFLQDTYRSLLSVQSKVTERNWVIFDNTAHGHATQNALQMKSLSYENLVPEINL